MAIAIRVMTTMIASLLFENGRVARGKVYINKKNKTVNGTANIITIRTQKSVAPEVVAEIENSLEMPHKKIMKVRRANNLFVALRELRL